MPDAGLGKSGCPRRGDPVAELIDECEKDGRERKLFHQVSWQNARANEVQCVRVGGKKREVHEVSQGSG